MALYTNKIDDVTNEKLANLSYRVDGMAKVIKLCLDDKFFNTQSDNFRQYNDEYNALILEYEEEKTKLYNTYIAPYFENVALNWSLNFNIKELTVEVDT